MPRNIEIKVRIADIDSTRARITALGAQPHATEKQVDRYYALEGERRLKLRTIDGRSAQLIEYRRPEASGVRASDYTVSPVRDTDQGACRVPKGTPLIVVSKEREILLLDNVRIHLDRVDGLGSFMELEAVVDAAHDDTVCHQRVDALLLALGIQEDELIRASYAELVGRTSP